MNSRVLWPAGGVLLAAYLLYLAGLGSVGLLSVDEPRYAWIGRGMAESGDWITPRLYDPGGAPWLEKPPLLYWMMAAAWKLGLRDEWAVRLPVAISALLFLALFWWSLLREFGGEVAARATAILSTTGGWLLYAHVGVTDIPLACTFGAAMLLAWRGQTVLAGIALGLAILAKALVPIAIALPVLAWWWWTSQQQEDRGRPRLSAITVPVLIGLAVAAPWYVVCYQRHGRALFDELIVRQHFARFLDAKSQVLHPQPFWFYVPVLIVLLLPWSPLLAAVRPRALWQKRPAQFFVIWLAYGFLFFSLSAGKLPGYLLPLLPAAAAILGLSLSSAEATHQRIWLTIIAGVAGWLYAAPHENLLENIVDSQGGGPIITSLGWLGLGAGLLVSLVWANRSLARTYATVAALLGALLHWAIPVANRHTAKPHASLVAEVCAEATLHRAWRYGLSYYAHRELPPCEGEVEKSSGETKRKSTLRWHATSTGTGHLYFRDSSADAGTVTQQR